MITVMPMVRNPPAEVRSPEERMRDESDDVAHPPRRGERGMAALRQVYKPENVRLQGLSYLVTHDPDAGKGQPLEPPTAARC